MGGAGRLASRLLRRPACLCPALLQLEDSPYSVLLRWSGRAHGVASGVEGGVALRVGIETSLGRTANEKNTYMKPG